MKRPEYLFSCLVLSVASLTACATAAPSQELLNARAAYDRARQSSAARLAPADVENARQALAVAERAHDDMGEAEARDLAYVAERKSLLALATGRAMEDERARADAETALKQLHEQQLAAARVEIGNEAQRSSAQQAQLTAEQAARASAEQRARDAVQKLNQLATIKEESRGTVLTLSGSVLFASGKSDLLPSARERLSQVADVLKAQPELSFTVIGHTDSQGSDEFNRDLSQRRADAVRQYLVSQGVDSSRVRSVGRGESEPIADNNTAEGRANNRRVEIVLSSHGFENDTTPKKAPPPEVRPTPPELR
jgi:outer membrane protein OmpA-like peptidoglycan-associated protein